MSAIPNISGYNRDANAVTLPEPTARSGATAGDPHESTLVVDSDQQLEIGIWECAPGRYPGARRGYNELMVFVAGAATITADGHEPVVIGPGGVYPTLDGWVAEWRVTETVRKVCVIWGDTR
jgi:uncharacterized protein